MDSNVTFRIDSEVKAQMATICDQIGMTTSTAFNIFAKAFVRAKGMPFPVTVQDPIEILPTEQLLTDGEQILHSFGEDYRRMAE